MSESGIVTRMRKRGVEISMFGSDQGVAEGQQFEIYRVINSARVILAIASAHRVIGAKVRINMEPGVLSLVQLGDLARSLP